MCRVAAVTQNYLLVFYLHLGLTYCLSYYSQINAGISFKLQKWHLTTIYCIFYIHLAVLYLLITYWSFLVTQDNGISWYKCFTQRVKYLYWEFAIWNCDFYSTHLQVWWVVHSHHHCISVLVSKLADWAVKIRCVCLLAPHPLIRDYSCVFSILLYNICIGWIRLLYCLVNSFLIIVRCMLLSCACDCIVVLSYTYCVQHNRFCKELFINLGVGSLIVYRTQWKQFIWTVESMRCSSDEFFVVCSRTEIASPKRVFVICIGKRIFVSCRPN